MKKEWFVLHTLTGKENKVLESIKARTRLEGMEEYIGQCLIPMEKVTETKNGKKRTINKKVFPGYVLVEMALYDESGAIDKASGKRVVAFGGRGEAASENHFQRGRHGEDQRGRVHGLDRPRLNG